RTAWLSEVGTYGFPLTAPDHDDLALRIKDQGGPAGPIGNETVVRLQIQPRGVGQLLWRGNEVFAEARDRDLDGEKQDQGDHRPPRPESARAPILGQSEIPHDSGAKNHDHP